MATRKQTTSKPSSSPAPATAFPSVLLGAALLIGLYAMLPAIFSGGIHLRRSVEVVDHVVPAVVLLVVTVVAILKGAKPDSLMLVFGVVIVLAGFWMVATHVSLAKQGLNHQASATGAAFHCSTAIAVAALGVAWAWRYRAAGSGTTPPPRAAASRSRR
jgi:vacuolar-type H+-ATPase subunit I/STV1